MDVDEEVIETHAPTTKRRRVVEVVLPASGPALAYAPGFPSAQVVRPSGGRFDPNRRPDIGPTPFALDRAAVGAGSPTRWEDVGPEEREKHLEFAEDVVSLQEQMARTLISGSRTAALRAARKAEESGASVSRAKGKAKAK